MSPKPKKKRRQGKVERVVYVAADPGSQGNPGLAVALLKGPAPTLWTGETWAGLAAKALREVVGPGWFLELLDYLASRKECPLREWCAAVGPDKCPLADRAVGQLLMVGDCLEAKVK